MSRVPPAVVVATLAMLTLAGCTVPDPSSMRTSGTAPTVRALELGWRTAASEPEWVPADATAIRFTATTNGPADETPAVVRATTGSPLPRTCTTAARPASDRFHEGWAPKAVPARVRRCGNWAVVRVPDGWYGWTPFLRCVGVSRPSAEKRLHNGVCGGHPPGAGTMGQ